MCSPSGMSSTSCVPSFHDTDMKLAYLFDERSVLDHAVLEDFDFEVDGVRTLVVLTKWDEFNILRAQLP